MFLFARSALEQSDFVSEYILCGIVVLFCKNLHNKETFDDAEVLRRVEAALAVEIPEVMPEDLKFEPSSSSFRLWRLIDVLVVLAIIAIFLVPIGVIVFVVRRKK